MTVEELRFHLHELDDDLVVVIQLEDSYQELDFVDSVNCAFDGTEIGLIELTLSDLMDGYAEDDVMSSDADPCVVLMT